MCHGCTDETEEISKVEVHLNIVTLTQHSLVTTVFFEIGILAKFANVLILLFSHLGGTMPPSLVTTENRGNRERERN